ncbi:hypothetical protein ACWD5R_10930 [Streptomyces sp. NPDC002514]|uniref:hypothetical protein n=1 Tax=Streptomyces sp. NPDC001270 TaxID=3364554 RepID=UPI0036C48974
MAVLALEDVHWADEATLEFLLFLVSRRPQPVSVVLPFRRDEVPPDSLLLWLSSRLPSDARPVRLTLGPLDVGETASFVSSMLAGGHVSSEFAAFLRARTEGVPLAVEESVRLMHDRADLIRRDGGWARRRLDRIEVPQPIRDHMLERVQRLRPDTRTVLYAVSVLSGPADHATLRAVTGLPEERFAGAAAEALDCGLLRSYGLPAKSARYTFEAKTNDVRTVWEYTSAEAAKDDAPELSPCMGDVVGSNEAACREPLIFLRYDFDLALDNTVKAGENHEITVVGTTSHASPPCPR